RLLAESTELENRSFPGVASFEEQRFRVSELWYRLGAAERELDDAKERTPPAGDVQALERRHRVMADEYERELTRRNRLWDDVEKLWTRSAEVNLMTCEARVLGRKVRRSAERLFGLAEERKKNTQALRAETNGSASAVEGARAKLASVRARAKELFGCSVGTDFIYFRHRDDQRHAFAIALVDDREAYNLEVKALAVYTVDRERGVGFLEPARAINASSEEGDRRFETYFLNGRKGAAKAP
ncbi:MAG: hypothetical protein JNG84_11895, partial [Archangium sp.]|nr:hypothetical protein [Archangium sp.]